MSPQFACLAISANCEDTAPNRDSRDRSASSAAAWKSRLSLLQRE
jgi:hypothetical protein